MVPPSPLLLALRITKTYLMVTTMISDQIISDSTARIFVSLGPPMASMDCLNA